MPAAAVALGACRPAEAPSEAAADPFTAAAPTASRLAAHVEYLAATERAGRFPGSAGIFDAEEYIIERMRAAGLEALDAQGGYAHEFTLYRADYDPETTGVSVVSGDQTVAVGRAGAGMRPLFLSDFGSISAPLVFGGYGIVAPEHGWNDYDGIDVRDRIVFMLRYEPGARSAEGGFGSAELSEHSLFTRKARNALERGARGMIVVTGPQQHDGVEDLRTLRPFSLEPHSIERRFARSRTDGFFAVQVSQELSGRILPPLGVDLAEVQAAVDAGRSAADFELGDLSATIDVAAARSSTPVAARNLVGVLKANAPGVEPERARWIVIGAHHDHLGDFGDDARRHDTVYHGADDNASGVAALLELAAYLSQGERALNLAFVTFTAEEQGLLGSRAFLRDKLIAAPQIELMLNLDMIGRNPDEPLRIYSGEDARSLVAAVLPRAGELGLEVELREKEIEPVSDHYSFHRAGVAVVSFFTGLHDDYHGVGDTADRLDYDRMEAITRLAAELIATAGSRPVIALRKTS